MSMIEDIPMSTPPTKNPMRAAPIILNPKENILAAILAPVREIMGKIPTCVKLIKNSSQLSPCNLLVK